jgi:hypothetical protein
MKPGMEPPLRSIVAPLACATALVMAVSISQAAARNIAAKSSAAAVRESTAQKQKPVKLRYFGGPKSAMY